MSNLDRSMHRSLWVSVTHSSFIEGSHTPKNMAYECAYNVCVIDIYVLTGVETNRYLSAATNTQTENTKHIETRNTEFGRKAVGIRVTR